MTDQSVLLVAAAVVLVSVLVGLAAIRHGEAVMSSIAVAGMLLVGASLVFTVMNAGVSGPLIILVLFAGLSGLILMLWHHWTRGIR